VKASILSKVIDDFRLGREILATEAEPFLDALILESDASVISSVLTAWHEKGIEENEIYEIARIMRERMTRVNSKHQTLVDIVGTGGSRAKTFNVSTAASLVVAGAAVPVAKHGNKAATSNSGSADVLSVLGVNPAVDAETAERCLNEIGICFMFAPNFHKLSPMLGKVRRVLGFPTIFNCVGPLCNPASASNQLIGVWDRALVPKIANALARLGTNKSWVVHGENGQDEIALNGTTLVAEVGSDVREFEISSEYFGFEPSIGDGPRINDPIESAALIREILSSGIVSHSLTDIALLNAAAALCLTDESASPADAAERVSESLHSGRANMKLTALAEATPA
jgi:anthranilate phosphoribosyltransferase